MLKVSQLSKIKQPSPRKLKEIIIKKTVRNQIFIKKLNSQYLVNLMLNANFQIFNKNRKKQKDYQLIKRGKKVKEDLQDQNKNKN